MWLGLQKGSYSLFNCMCLTTCKLIVNMLSPWYFVHLSSLYGTMTGCNMKVIGCKHNESNLTIQEGYKTPFCRPDHILYDIKPTNYYIYLWLVHTIESGVEFLRVWGILFSSICSLWINLSFSGKAHAPVCIDNVWINSMCNYVGKCSNIGTP